MHRDVDDIEIQDPPIHEIKKRSSCLRRSCMSVLVVLIASIVFFIAVIHFFVQPHAEAYSTIPKDFPLSVPVYDTESITRIRHTPGDERAEGLELLAYVPKAIIAPIVMTLDNNDAHQQDHTDSLWSTFVLLLNTPVADHRNITTIEWKGIAARPSFLQEFYKTELSKEGFTLTDASKTFLRFEKNTITIHLNVERNSYSKGTDYAILKVFY